MGRAEFLAGLLTLAATFSGSLVPATAREFRGSAQPAYRIVSDFGLSANDGAVPTGLVEADNAFWGTTQIGGSAISLGTIFRLTPAGRATVLVFQSYGPQAGFPGPLTRGPDGLLYGTTGSTLFALNPVSLHFSSVGFEASNFPVGLYGALVSDGNRHLYGIAQGANIDSPDCGAVYSYDVATRAVAPVYQLPWGNGACPFGQVSADTLNYAGGLIYGSVRSPIDEWEGAIFSVRPDGSGFRIVRSFDRGRAVGPGPIVISGSTIYGAATGAYGRTSPPYLPTYAATLYAMALDGSGLRVLHTFPSGSDTWTTVDSLTLDAAGRLLGTTTDGLGPESGSAFALSPDGTYRTLHQFDSVTGGSSPVALLASRSGLLYGVTPFGGAGTRCSIIYQPEGCGTVFVLDPHGRGPR